MDATAASEHSTNVTSISSVASDSTSGVVSANSVHGSGCGRTWVLLVLEVSVMNYDGSQMMEIVVDSGSVS